VHFSLTDLAADIAQNGAESGAGTLELEIRETAGFGSPPKKEFRFTAGDNGKGMTAAELERAMDPFVTDGVKHPGRRVGLGIPFLIQTALQSGGGWKISSVKAGAVTVRSGGERSINAGPGDAGPNAAKDGSAGSNANDAANKVGASGTTVEAWFDLVNVDTPPVGDIPGLFRTALLFPGPEEIVLRRSRTGFDGSNSGGGSSEKTADLDYEVKKTELIEALGGDLEDVSSLVMLGQYLRSLEGDGE